MVMSYLAIAQTLKQCREEKNLTQEELAQFFGAGVSLIEKWESGAAEPTVSEALILGRLYGGSLDEMFERFDARAMIPAGALEAYDGMLQKNGCPDDGVIDFMESVNKPFSGI